MIAVRVISLGALRNSQLSKLRDCVSSYEVIPAIDGRQIEMSQGELTNRNPSFNGAKNLSFGEVACSRSHAKALTSFIGLADANISHCLILEDDVSHLLPAEKLITKLNLLCSKLMMSNTLLHCGGMDGMRFERYFKLREKLTYRYLSPIEAKVLYRACAYVVDINAAKIFRDYLMTEPPVVADDWHHLIRTTSLSIKSCNLFCHPLDLFQSALELHRHGK
jgi:GR25 family glycosyltransferase involved in LPS biosynthesis